MKLLKFFKNQATRFKDERGSSLLYMVLIGSIVALDLHYYMQTNQNRFSDLTSLNTRLQAKHILALLRERSACQAFKNTCGLAATPTSAKWVQGASELRWSDDSGIIIGISSDPASTHVFGGVNVRAFCGSCNTTTELDCPIGRKVKVEILPYYLQGGKNANLGDTVTMGGAPYWLEITKTNTLDLNPDADDPNSYSSCAIIQLESS